MPDWDNSQPKPPPRAFTLVELLVAIMIVTILATMVLFAMAGVTEKAREDRTRSQIAKINELLAEKWESYLTRRVVLKKSSLTQVNPGFAARQQLYARRELMRVELPERQADLIAVVNYLTNPQPANSPEFLRSWPTLARAYAKRVTPTWTTDFQNAECLYLILSQMREEDFSALEFFSENEIGDVDGDGMPEILDAWGTPIRWLRWAPGWVSPLQPLETPSGQVFVNVTVADFKGQSDAELFEMLRQAKRQGEDLFDPSLADPRLLNYTGRLRRPFELRPLVMSAGSDREFDVTFYQHPQRPVPIADSPSSGDPKMYYAQTNQIKNDPYAFLLVGFVKDNNDPDGDGVGQGNGIDESLDNIHNHLIETQ